MSDKTTLNNLLEIESNLTKTLDHIEVPLPGDSILLLRVRKMPEFAFVMWRCINTTTASQMAFKMPNGDESNWYPVVCACCPSETSGLNPPKGDAEELEWKVKMAEEFKRAMIDTCRENGVTTIFMRRASAWSECYGDVDGLEIVEAASHFQAFTYLYGRKVVEDSLQFIHPSSRGLNPGPGV
jgi:hypothetical protein